MKLPGNMQQMMKQAQQMQENMQEEIAQIRVEATAGGGMVTVDDGRPQEPARREDRSGSRGRCRDAAGHDHGRVNEAVKKVDGEIKQKMGGMLGGMGLPPGMF